MSGSFNVTLTDGVDKKTFHMNRSFYRLYVPPLIWREIDNFCYGSVCTILASGYYDPSEYYRDYHEFLKVVVA